MLANRLGTTKRLIAANRETAGAAKQSADTAKQALTSTQRAFVFINSFEVNVIGKEVRIIPKWENSGVTLGNPMKHINWKAFRGAPPSDYGYPDLDSSGAALPSRGEAVEFFIGPKAIMLGTPVRIPISVMEEMRSGNLRIFVWGWAEYKDIFENTILHTTKFCSEIEITDLGREGDKTTVAAFFTTYGPYNSAN
jgi:hypothetical protein